MSVIFKDERFAEMMEQILAENYLELTENKVEEDGLRVITDHRHVEAAEFMDFRCQTTQQSIEELHKEINGGSRYYFFAPGEMTPHVVYKDYDSQCFVYQRFDTNPMPPEPPKKPSFFHRVAHALTLGRAYGVEFEAYKNDRAAYEDELESYNAEKRELETISGLLKQRELTLNGTHDQYSGSTREQENAYKAAVDAERAKRSLPSRQPITVQEMSNTPVQTVSNERVSDRQMEQTMDHQMGGKGN